MTDLLAKTNRRMGSRQGEVTTTSLVGPRTGGGNKGIGGREEGCMGIIIILTNPTTSTNRTDHLA